MALSVSAVRAGVAWVVVAVLAIGSPGYVLAQDVSPVAEIAVAGNANINTDTILNVVKLKPGDPYTEEASAADRAAIMSLGSFSAVTVHTEQVANGLRVVYEVTENPKITKITVVGSGPVPAEKIIEIMKTRVGQILNSTTVNQDIGAIQAHYAGLGYLGYVTEDIDVDPQTGVLTVPILVSTVEAIEITGNRKTKTYVFLREMELKKGDYFNRKQLNDDIISIYNLDILESIKLDEIQILPGSEMGLVRIVLPVVEKKTGLVSLGFGYSSRQKLVGQARLAETNFRGKGQGLNLLFEQGTSGAVGGNSSYEIGFHEPWLDKRNTSLSISAYNKVLYRFSSGVFGDQDIGDDDKTYNERHKGLDLTVSRPLNEATRVYVGGRFENVETDPELLTADLAPIVQDGDVTTGLVRAVHNTRDYDLDPGSGGYESVSLEFGWVDATRFETIVDGESESINKVPFDGTYTKGAVDLRRYFSRGGRKSSPQDKRTTIAVRLRAGIASGEVPFFEQFFVGGGETLRGYREDRFWGKQMLVASLEYRQPIGDAMTGVAFFDYGDAWGGDEEFEIDSSLEQSSSFSGHYGVGIGIRVTTPIGHLRLDYGYGDEGGRTHFSMGHAF